jgi:caffeoyl-CoA O-methyltransferase
MDLNVPESDGKLLYNLVIKNHYTKALEIGTLRGYSAMWIARALTKTRGRLITIEIDAGRYRQALANFKAAGPCRLYRRQARRCARPGQRTARAV